MWLCKPYIVIVFYVSGFEFAYSFNKVLVCIVYFIYKLYTASVPKFNIVRFLFLGVCKMVHAPA